MNDKQPLPKDIETLLPWYINGTLNESEMDRVAAALEATGSSAKLLDVEVALSQRLVESPPELEQVLKQRARSFESLRAKLTSSPSRVVGRNPRRRFARKSPVAAVSIGFVVAVATIWLATLLPQSNEFSTLSETPAPSAAVIVQVAVKADVSRQQTQRLADHLHASIVSGPSPRNVYEFALPMQSEATADLKWIRDQPEVLFADVQVR